MTLRELAAALPAMETRSIAEVEDEIRDELEFHLEMRTLDNLRSGMTPLEARTSAEAQFGDFDRVRHECRRTLLGERIMLQKLQTALIVLLIAVVAWLAYRIHSGQRTTEAAMADFSAAIKQLAERPGAAPLQPSEPTKPAVAASDWRANRPVVIATSPATGEMGVDPSTSEIRVTFDKEMADRSWSWVRASDYSFPVGAGEVHYLADGRTCVMPVKLEPNTKYVVWLNSASYQNFKDSEGRPAEPYLLTFTTGE